MKYIKKVLATTAVEEDESTAGKPEQSAIDKWLDAGGGTFGKKSQSGWTEGDKVWSYHTVIGKLEGKTLYVNSNKYSPTTSKLVGYLKVAAKQRSYKIVEKDEAFFETSMKEKLPSGANKGKKGANLIDVSKNASSFSTIL